MKIFKDTAGREWKMEITIGSVNRVKDELGIDLLAPGNKPSAKADERVKEVMYKNKQAPLVSCLNADASLLFDVICLTLKPQLEKTGTSVDEFIESMGGDAAYDAYQAFMGEWVDFFQKLHRPDAARMVQKNLMLIEAEAKRNELTVEKMADAVILELERKRTEIESKIADVGSGVLSTDMLAISE